MMISAKTFVIGLFCSVVLVSGSGVSWEHSDVLDRQKQFRMFWNVTDENIIIKLSVNTTGWIGIGFSDTGSMIGADIHVGWVKNGNAYISDRHGTNRNGFPPADAQQDVELIEGYECNGWTTIVFRRQLAACEVLHDKPITRNTMRVLFAYSINDPRLQRLSHLDYHSFRRSKSMLLLGRIDNNHSQDSLPSFTITNDGNPMPTPSTYYHCRILEIDQSLPEKPYIVKIEPIIDEANANNIHHMLIQACPSFVKNFSIVGRSEDCYGRSLQDSRYCVDLIVGWAVGGGPMIFPKDVGLPMGVREHTRYIKLEIHYDNPNNEVLRDQSGFRFFYVTEKPKYEAGSLMVGHYLAGYNLVVPPRSSQFDIFATCGSRCLGTAMEMAGRSSINLFGVFLHTHRTGKQVELRHIRNNTELDPIIYDQSYDYDYQETRKIIPERVIQRGDYLQTVCTYSTNSKDILTEGGLATEEEMCAAFLYYYPLIPLSICNSAPLNGLSIIKQSVGVNGTRSHNSSPNYLLNRFKNIMVLSPAEKANRTLDVAINEFDWTDSRRDRLSENLRRDSLLQMCAGPQPAVRFQEVIPPLSPYQSHQELPNPVCVEKKDLSITSLIKMQCSETEI